LVLLKF